MRVCVCHGGLNFFFRGSSPFISYPHPSQSLLPFSPPAICTQLPIGCTPSSDWLSENSKTWALALIGWGWGSRWWRSGVRGERRSEMLFKDVNGHLSPSASRKQMTGDAGFEHWQQRDKEKFRKNGLLLDDNNGILRICVVFLSWNSKDFPVQQATFMWFQYFLR